jgi:zinc and cadmium transporter
VSALAWIVLASIVMTLIALIGATLLLLRPTTARAFVLPLVAFAAGSLIGSAFFHLLPDALGHLNGATHVWLSTAAGFAVFFALEQLLHWHHHHSGHRHRERPLTYLLLIGDSLHNFIDGVAVAAAFVTDIGLGITTTIAVAAHEIPQEFGDMAVLIHGGWSKARAVIFNLLTSLTFLVGALLTFVVAAEINVSYVVAFAAGTFLYIGATDLVPEINKLGDLKRNLLNLAMFLLGLAAMYAAAVTEH